MIAFDLNQVTENRIFFRTAVLRKLSDITDSHTNTEIPHAVAYSSTVTRSKHRNKKKLCCPQLNRPAKYKPPRGLYLEIALKYKVKQSKNGKFPSNYKASPIDFETQISLLR